MKAVLLETALLCLADLGPPRHATTVRHLVDLLLTSDVDPRRLAEIASTWARKAEGDALHQWLRAWTHADALAAADWLLALKPPKVRSVVVERVASALEGDFRDRRAVIASSLVSPDAVQRWVSMLHIAVRPEDDLHHEGVYHPSARDHAQDLRHRLLGALSQSPTQEAHSALLNLQADPAMAPYATNVARLLVAQEELATEAQARAFSEVDILRTERGDRRPPTTVGELFELVRRDLREVARLIENDDFSYRSLFLNSTKEREIQLWAASSLQRANRGDYTVHREPVVDDDKEVDISAAAGGVGRVPVEIKPVGATTCKYTLRDLQQCIDRQLLGRYMLPAAVTHGVLLVVRKDQRKWRAGRRVLEFDGLIRLLRQHADKRAAQLDKVVSVETIDLTNPGSTSKAAGARKHATKTARRKVVKKAIREPAKRRTTKRNPPKPAKLARRGR